MSRADSTSATPPINPAVFALRSSARRRVRKDQDRKAKLARRSHRQLNPVRGRGRDSQLQGRRRETWRRAKTSRNKAPPARGPAIPPRARAGTSAKARRRTSTAKRRIFQRRKQLSAAVV